MDIYTAEQIINLIKEKANEFGRTPYCNEIRKICNLAIYHFKTWNKALKKAGLKVNKRSKLSEKQKKKYKANYDKKHRKKSKDYENNEKRNYIVNELLKLKEKLKRTPTIREFSNMNKKISEYLIYKYFKDYKDLFNLAGLESTKITSSKEKIIKKIQEIAKELGRTPTWKESKIPYKTLKEHIGTYTQAVIAAGLTPNRKV